MFGWNCMFWLPGTDQSLYARRCIPGSIGCTGCEIEWTAGLTVILANFLGSTGNGTLCHPLKMESCMWNSAAWIENVYV